MGAKVVIADVSMNAQGAGALDRALRTLEDVRQAVRRLGSTYKQQWLIERHGYRTPNEPREHLRAQAAAAG